VHPDSVTAPKNAGEAPVVPQTTVLAGVRGPSARMLSVSLWAVGCMWVLPFLLPFKALPVPSFWAEAAAAGLGLVALTVWAPWARSLAFPRVAWLPLGFVALLVLQLSLGRVAYYQQAILAVLYLLWACALIILGGTFRRELGLTRVAITLAWFLCAGGVLSAIIGLAQLLESYDVLGRFITVASGNRVWGNLAQANHLADYLSLGLASTAFLYAIGRLRPVYTVFVACLVVYILALTGSRGTWFYLAAMLVLSAGFYVKERNSTNRRLVVFCVTALLALYLLPVLVNALQFASGSTGITAAMRMTSGQFAEERPRLWYAAWLMFREAPWLGLGYRHFGLGYFILNETLPLPRVIGFNDHAHNLFLNVIAEFGLVGLAVLLAGTIPWLLSLWRQPRTPAMWWLLALIAVLTIHSLLEYPLWYTFFLGVTAIVLGACEVRTLELSDVAGRFGRLRLTLVAILLLGWFVLLQVVRDYSVLESFQGFRYRYIHATQEVADRTQEMLTEVSPGSLLLPWVELGLARTIHISGDKLSDKLAVNGRAMRVFPIDDVVYRQAMLLALAGDDEAARLQWEQAVAAFPEQRDSALRVLRRRVEDGLAALQPLLEYAQKGSRDSAHRIYSEEHMAGHDRRRERRNVDLAPDLQAFLARQGGGRRRSCPAHQSPGCRDRRRARSGRVQNRTYPARAQHPPGADR
jgi:O-antigen ligase